jgi:hypothetical protein
LTAILTQHECTREGNTGKGPSKSQTLTEEGLPLEIATLRTDALLRWERISPLTWNSAVPIELQAAARHSVITLLTRFLHIHAT